MTPTERDAFDTAFVDTNFSFDHLPDGPLRSTSRMHATLAQDYLVSLPCNNQRTKALEHLLAAKDAAVRAHLPRQP